MTEVIRQKSKMDPALVLVAYDSEDDSAPLIECRDPDGNVLWVLNTYEPAPEEPTGGKMPKPLGYEQLATLTTATALASIPVGDGAFYALIQANAQDVRWRDDGTNPTAAIGMLLKAGGEPLRYEGDLRKIRFIEVTAGGKIDVSYYGV